MTAALEGGEWSAARPGRTLPPGKTRYPLYRRLGGPQGRSGRAEYLVPTGIRSWTIQPVAQSLYRLSYQAHQGVYIIHIYWQIVMELMCSFVYLLHFSSFISIIFFPPSGQFHCQAAAGLAKRSSSARMYLKPQALRCAEHDAISV